MADQNIVKAVISGGFNNSDPSISFGGLPSHVNPAGIIVSDSPINLFDTVDLARATAGEFQYLCIYVFGNSTEIGSAVRFWMDRDTFNDENEFAWGFENEANANRYHYEPHQYFNGVDDEITISYNAIYDLLQFSIACWFRTSTSDWTDEGFFISKGGTGSDTVGQNLCWGMWMDVAGKIVGGFEDNAGLGADHYVTSPLSYDDGDWHFAVITYDQVTVKLYMDGNTTPVATHATTTTPEVNTKLIRIGANPRLTPAVDFYHGDLDEVRVWNNDLTSAEMAALYSAGTIPQEAAMIYENKFGLDNGSIIAQKIPNITTAPTGVTFQGVGGSPEDSIEFWNIRFKFLKRNVPPDNNAGDSYFPIWIRRRILANSKDSIDNKGIWKVSVDLTRENTPSPTPDPDEGGGGEDGGGTKIYRYTYASKFGSKGNGNGQFQDPHDAGFNSTGDVFITDRIRNDVQRFTRDGKYKSKFGGSGSADGQLNVPYSCEHDSSDNLYICDRENNRVQKFDSSGVFVSKITTINGKALDQPEDITFDKANGDIYILDTGNDRCCKLTSAHVFILEWGKTGKGNGEFEHPHSINTDSNGDVFISCGDLPYIQKFDKLGNFIKKWGKEGDCDGCTRMFLEHMDIDKFDNVHLVNNDDLPIVNVWDNEGNWLTAYGKRTSGSANGQFKEPEHITCELTTGNPYVVDAKNQRVQIFNVTVTEEGGGGSDPPAEADNATLHVLSDTDCKNDTKDQVAAMKKIDPAPQAWLHAGDIQYGSSASCIFTTFGTLDSKVIVAMGNHDKFSNYSGHWNLSKSYYSKVIQNIGIIVMDSETSFSAGSAQHTFVINELKKFHDDSNIDWKIVMFHRPMYGATGGSQHDPDEGNKTGIYMAEFDKYGVDLIIQGHNHNTQRSCQIVYQSSGNHAKIVDSNQNTYTKGKGRICMIVGAGGHDGAGSLYTIGTPAAYNKFENDQDLLFATLFFTGTNNTVMTGKIFNQDLDVQDEFTITNPI
jgi:predicted phosphodiesterase